MSETMQWKWSLPLLVALGWSAAASGCAPDCTQLKKDFEAALGSESPFIAGGAATTDPAIHFGIAVRDDVLNEVVDHALRTGLEKALTLSDGISLATGQKIGLGTEGKIADLGLYPDKACETCLRVDGQLGGTLTVKLPLLGSQRVPLSGTFSVVAPVKFGKNSEGNSTVLLDLSEAAKLAKSHVTPETSQLPPTWWKVIEGPLAKLMAEAIARDLPPVTLFTFRGFDLGIEGLEVSPAKIVSDAKRGVVFAGFTTNLASDGAALLPRTDLGKNDDVAIGIDRRVLPALTVAMLKGKKLSRTWTKDGKESPAGPISITMPTVSLPDGADGAQPYQMGFRAWNVPEEGKCWWAEARASGTVEAGDKGELRVAVDDVKITDSSLPGVLEAIANWRTSQLIGKSSQAVTKTLSPAAVNLGGSAVSLSKSHLSLAGDGAWLMGSVDVKKKAVEGGDDEEGD